MNIKMKWIKTLLILSGLVASSGLYAQGHYAGSIFNPNDYFVSRSPGWVFSMYYSYSQMDYFNNSGEKTDVIEINQDPPFSVTMGQNVKTNSILPMAIYFAKNKILNARWGLLAIPMINNPNANLALDFYSGQTIAGSNTINFKSFGLGDMYLQPLWLTWGEKKISTTFSYGAWVPTGKYKTDDPENIGLGYWSHNFRVASRYQPVAKMSLTAAVTVEVNSKQKGTDFIESPHITLDYGASYNFLMGHEIGFYGSGTWQTSDDKGEKAVLLKDRCFGIGVYGSYWILPGKLGILSRFTGNFGVKNRFGGPNFQIGINYLLMNHPDTN